MADNVILADNSGAKKAATDEVSYSGDTADVQLMRPVHVSGSEGSKTVVAMTDTNGVLQQGNVADDVADAGNPIKIGGKVFTSTPTALVAGRRINSWWDQWGRLSVSLTDPELGNTPGRTSLRDQLVVERCTELADSLADGLAGFWTSSTANGGTTTSSGGEGLIQTSANAAGSAQLTSTTVNYYPGMVAWMNSAARFNDTGSAGNIRRIGVFTVSGTTPQNGAYFELDGTTLNAVVINGGTPTATASGSWSRFADAPFTLDTNYHSFELRYTANTVQFYVDNILRHSLSGTSSAITATLNFPITIQSINTSGATNRLIAVRNIGVGRFGSPLQTVEETGLGGRRSLAVGGGTSHDAVDSGNPLKVGGYASAAAPTSVAGSDRVNAWFLLNGAQATVLTAAGALIGGDVTNGLDVDVTRVKPDGTNTMPSLDAVARRGYVQHTDGTNSTPAMDAAARAGYIILTNGTLSAGLVDETGASAVDSQAVGGGTPHDSVDSGNPLLNGFRAIAHGTNPTAVAAADRTVAFANRAGIPFVIGGHPNVVSYTHSAITTAVTDSALVTVAAGLKIVVTGLTVTLDNASTVFPSVRIGFGTANVPSLGNVGILLAHGGLAAGGGVNRGDGSGILGVGTDDQDLRITTVGNATGNGIQVTVAYYTCES